MPKADSGADGTVGVMWREGTWKCELGLVHGYPVLRLCDGDIVELEHEIMPETIPETAEVMRQAVLRYISGPDMVAEAKAPRPESPRKMVAHAPACRTCPHCRSLRAFIWGSRPGKEWYYCP